MSRDGEVWDNYHRDECGLGDLINDAEEVRKIYECNGILPLTRKPLSDYDGPKDEQNVCARLF